MEEENKTTEYKILEAAVTIFAQKGFSASTTKEIATQAGVAEGTIFRYFPKKKDILHGILLKMIEVVGPKILGSGLKEIFSNQLQKDDKEVIKAFLNNRIHLFESYFPLFKVIINESQYHPDLQVVFFEKVIPTISGMIEEFFKEGIEQGRFKNYHSSAMTIALLGCMASNIIARSTKVLTKEVSLDELLEDSINIFLFGISK